MPFACTRDCGFVTCCMHAEVLPVTDTSYVHSLSGKYDWQSHTGLRLQYLTQISKEE